MLGQLSAELGEFIQVFATERHDGRPVAGATALSGVCQRRKEHHLPWTLESAVHLLFCVQNRMRSGADGSVS